METPATAPHGATVTNVPALAGSAYERVAVRHLLRAEEPPTEAECAAALGLTDAAVRELVGQLSLVGLVDTVGGRLKAVAGWRSSRLPPGGVWSTLEGL